MDNVQISTRSDIVCRIKNQKIYQIYENDWVRIKTLLQRSKPTSRIYHTAYTVMFSVSATAVFTLITIATINDPPLWPIIATWNMLIVPLILGIIFFLVDKKNTSGLNSTIDDVFEEMRSIEDAIDIPNGKDATLARKKTSRIAINAEGKLYIRDTEMHS